MLRSFDFVFHIEEKNLSLYKIRVNLQMAGFQAIGLR